MLTSCFAYSGSDLVSDHAKRDLHLLLAKRPEFETGDYEGAIKGALADEDAVLLESFKSETTEPAVSGSTAAICLVNLTKGDLVVGNLGDSHVILAERDPKTGQPYHIVSVVGEMCIGFRNEISADAYTNNQRRLTKSHKPETPGERSRIEEAGGSVNNRSGTPRVGELVHQ